MNMLNDTLSTSEKLYSYFWHYSLSMQCVDEEHNLHLWKFLTIKTLIYCYSYSDILHNENGQVKTFFTP